VSLIYRSSKPFFYAVIILFFLFSATVFNSKYFPQAAAKGFGTVINPEKYIVRPGDRFRIDFWDGSTKAIDVTVTPEGSLLLPSIGALKISSQTLIEAKKRLNKLIGRFYGEADFTISLVGVRPVKVLVTGAVKNPGLYEGSAFSRVSELIETAGGFIDGASRREIKFFGYNEDRIIDILRYERTGDLEANPNVYSGDKIQVPLISDSSSFVHMSGEVIMPGGFEYKEGDRLGTVIELARGFTGLESDSIYIYRKNNGYFQPVVKSVSDVEFPVQKGDKIIVGRAADRQTTDYFSIVGEINMPGCYPYQSGLSLEKAIKYVNGLTPRADIFSLCIFRKLEFKRSGKSVNNLRTINPNNLAFIGDMEPVSLKIDRSFPQRLDEINILPGDSIVIPTKSGLACIYGMVDRPGMVAINGCAKASDLIRKAGGFSPNAYRKTVMVIRKSSGMKITANPGITIFDGDTIIIEEDKNKKSTWDKLKDISLILGGVSMVYLAVDNLTD